jgi:DNA-binding SARP family transcriptional activator/Tfp pilus assembly protein PilF
MTEVGDRDRVRPVRVRTSAVEPDSYCCRQVFRLTAVSAVNVDPATGQLPLLLDDPLLDQPASDGRWFAAEEPFVDLDCFPRAAGADRDFVHVTLSHADTLECPRYWSVVRVLLRFCVLGPLRVCDGADVVPIRSAPQRRVLAMLLARNGEPVRLTELVDGLWPAAPPENAEGNVRSYRSRLNGVLGKPDRIVHGPAGYAIRLSPGELDAREFAQLAEQARTARGAGDLANAAELLDQALALWRGEPYAGLEDCQFLSPEIQGLREQRLKALEDYAEVSLKLGRHADLVPALAARLAEHPDRERLAGLLMRAQYGSGQQAAALETYRRTRDFLAEEHGVEPGAELRAVHEAVLRRDPGLEPRPAPAVPMQLRTGVNGFAGRANELAQLDAVLDAVGRQSTAVVISAVSGTAGVGKTALALHWAHRVRDRFPDGQLYVNLRGFDQSGQVLAPADAVRGFLDALGVPSGRIPVELDAQAALYRSLLDGKRVLVVLDNARDSEQVRPLLPGSSRCLAIVTSRNQLTSLLVNEGAQPLSLDLLAPAEARELLAKRIGQDRVAAEPQAVAEIVELCARLPLALAIVAARAAANRRFPLNVVATELREARGRLDAFADARDVFSWSYRQLGPAAQRLFRLLGLHPGPDISASAAASLAGLPPTHLRPLLTELTSASLVAEHVPGRYTFHDLLRAYATELTNTCDTEADRHATIHRMLDHYLHTAYLADRLLDGWGSPLPLPPLQAGVTPEQPTDPEQAMSWFTAEHAALLAILHHAAATGFHIHAWQLACSVNTFLSRKGHMEDRAVVWLSALDAARSLDDRAVQAIACRMLGGCYRDLGRYDEARACLWPALELSRELGEHSGEAIAYLGLSSIFELQGRYAEALDHAQHAFRRYEAMGDLEGESWALNAIGWVHTQLGQHRLALDYCRQALALLQEEDDREAYADTLDSLGYVHHRLNQLEDAAVCYQQALDLYRRLGYRAKEAGTLRRLGDTQLAAGDVDSVRRSWQRALAIIEELGHPYAEQLRVKLDSIG